MVGTPTFRDSDFILLKPGEKIEYGRETLGDPSDKFLFPAEALTLCRFPGSSARRRYSTAPMGKRLQLWNYQGNESIGEGSSSRNAFV